METAIPQNTASQSTVLLKTRALELGFALCGITPPKIGVGGERLQRWLDGGRHGEMEYMATNQLARADPAHVLNGVRSIVMVALPYRGQTLEPDESQIPIDRDGRISRYAWGRDYHDVLRAKLRELGLYFESIAGDLSWRAVVDSAPLMERDYAQLAGLGWFGKNTLLLNKKVGSFFFLGALLVDRELTYDQSHDTSHCGSCTRCLDACPTNAFDGPYQLDPRRCISYLTIEHRTTIAEPLRAGMGNWIFGCDICQDVCPWNQKTQRPGQPTDVAFSPHEGNDSLELSDILELTDEQFRKRFRGTPLFRAKRDRVVRNACIAAGNSGNRRYIDLLEPLTHDANELVQEAADWALDRLKGTH